MYTFLIPFKNLLPFYYYRKEEFCYRLPKNHLISGELITCQNVEMLFVFYVALLNFFSLPVFVTFLFGLERGTWKRDIHKGAHPHFLLSFQNMRHDEEGLGQVTVVFFKMSHIS